jgi:hypothetical protein
MNNSISLKIEGLDQVIRNLQRLGQQAPRAIALAVNDTARHVRSEASKGIRAEWNVKAKTIREAIKTRPATTANPEAQVTASSKPLPLYGFGPRKLKRGYSVRIKKGKPPTRLPKTFVATMRSGHVGLFERMGKRRLPIREKASITIPSQWAQRIEIDIRDAQPFLLRRLAGQIERLLAKKR